MRALPQNLPTVAEKIQDVMVSYSTYTEMCRVRNTLRGQIRGDQPSVAAEDLSFMKFAPITSCEVERTFNRYKAIFRDNRQSFIFENLKEYAIVACSQWFH